MAVQLFLSCVSDEFGAYRDALRHALTRRNVEIKIQEDFKQEGGDTLHMLEDYIEQCEAVVHFAGEMMGSTPAPSSVDDLLARRPGFGAKLATKGVSREALANLSYTQWEAWLAVGFDKDLLIVAPAQNVERGPAFAPTDASRASQADHLKRLRAINRYPGPPFTSADNLVAQIFGSAVIDALVKAEVKPSRLLRWSVAFTALVLLTASSIFAVVSNGRPDPSELAFESGQASAYKRLLSIAQGQPKSQCVANPSGSNVQLFDRGWMLIRRDTIGPTKLYAIVRTEEPEKIQWIEEADQSTGVDVSCPPFENDQLIHYGFRWLYCKATSSELRAKLGKPITGEIPAWVQFQEWSKGLLVYGVPGVDPARDKVVRGVFMKEAFLQLVGFFLDGSDTREAGFRKGEMVDFAQHHGEPRNVYCTALWYRANSSNNYMTEDLWNRPDCGGIKTDGQNYITPRPQCNVLGFK